MSISNPNYIIHNIQQIPQMKIKPIIIALGLIVTLNASAQQFDPLTKAVLNGYKQILEENPKDYETLYQRATQYYKLSMYDNALVDIMKALDFTPAKEKSLRIDEFSMLSDIYIQTKDYEQALQAVNNALALSPSDYALLYKKGNICLYLNNPEEAITAFSSMQRLKSRSQEAFFGMAKSNIMMGNNEAARELIREAEKADPSGWLTFSRIGDLYSDMNEDENAAANYLSAFSLADNDTSRPLQSLIKLADKNYPAVEAAIQYAISRSSNPDALYFLQANIAYNSGSFNEAYKGFSKLLESKEGQIGSVYAKMALTCLALEKFSEAQTNADMAALKENSVNTLVTKAKVYNACGNAPVAMMSASKALRIDANSPEAQVELALANLQLDDSKAALQSLNEVALTAPDNAYALMIRAYVNFDIINDAKEAIHQYARISELQEDSFPGITYKAMAKCFAGKKLDADEIMKRALKDANSLNKDDYYWASVYYAQTGNLTEAMSLIQKSIAAGYQNRFNLYSNKIANLNISPIRHLLKK